jgi:hypothetical protein
LEKIVRIFLKDTSSTKRRCVRCRDCEILIPGKEPNLFSSEIALLIPSTTKRKSRDDNGHPCIKPIFEVKKEEVEPLISTTNEVVVRQFMAQFMKGTTKPKWVSNKQIYNQITLSYALERSIFNTTPFNFLVFML